MNAELNAACLFHTVKRSCLSVTCKPPYIIYLFIIISYTRSVITGSPAVPASSFIQWISVTCFTVFRSLAEIINNPLSRPCPRRTLFFRVPSPTRRCVSFPRANLIRCSAGEATGTRCSSWAVLRANYSVWGPRRWSIKSRWHSACKRAPLIC